MQQDHFELNASLNLVDSQGKMQLHKDKEALRHYFREDVNKNTVFFHSLEEKMEYLVKEDYYEQEVLDKYSFEFIKALFKRAYGKAFRFQSFVGAYKYYTSYTLKTFDGKRYLERYEDRVCMNALYLGNGDEQLATSLVDEVVSGRFQPATPTFLNCGKKQRGELVSCFLLRIEDNMESIGRSINAALQLSKRGGGVAFLLSNIREKGAPIKKVKGQSSGVIPIMKLLEDSFSYANQLGSRAGAGAVYLSAHHPDILEFLDTKRENADEKIRIKTLSTGVVIPNITYQLAKENKDMYLFSPYDVERVYGVPFSEIDVTEKYFEMVDNPDITKTNKTNARAFFTRIAELQFESGYPFILNTDIASEASAFDSRINMSNLCSEILQTNSASEYSEDSNYSVIGKDISCNLGSMNVAMAMESPDLGKTVETAVRALTAVSDKSNINCVPSIQEGNKRSHAIGLGQMNLAGFFAKEKMHYGDEESLDFTNLYFYTVAYHVYKASCKIAAERKEVFDGFYESSYYTGEFFKKYTEGHFDFKTDKVREIFAKSGIELPTQQDWKHLVQAIQTFGLYHSNHQAIPPTGSISYLNNSTASIHPVTDIIEKRKEGKIGRVYYPAPFLAEDNVDYYRDAYKVGYKALIDVYAEATPHVDQGLSLTLFFPGEATTRDLNKAYIYAWKKGIKTLYYTRIRQSSLEGTETEGCVSCSL